MFAEDMAPSLGGHPSRTHLQIRLGGKWGKGQHSAGLHDLRKGFRRLAWLHQWCFTI